MLSAILKGLALGFILSISVGPIIFSILKQSINHGHKGGFVFIRRRVSQRYHDSYSKQSFH